MKTLVFHDPVRSSIDENVTSVTFAVTACVVWLPEKLITRVSVSLDIAELEDQPTMGTVNVTLSKSVLAHVNGAA